MDMTMTAVNLAIAGTSSAKIEQSRLLLAELRDEIVACKLMLGHTSASLTPDHTPGSTLGDMPLHPSSSTTDLSHTSHSATSRPASIMSTTSTRTLTTLFRTATVRTARTTCTTRTSRSVISYRASSIIDLYCDSIASLEREESDRLSDREDATTIKPKRSPAPWNWERLLSELAEEGISFRWPPPGVLRSRKNIDTFSTTGKVSRTAVLNYDLNTEGATRQRIGTAPRDKPKQRTKPRLNRAVTAPPSGAARGYMVEESTDGPYIVTRRTDRTGRESYSYTLRQEAWN